MMPTALEMIEALRLEPLPDEGGFYRETWVLPSPDGRPAGTAIMYLITPEAFSALHRLDADEIFHFYLGDACEQIVIDPMGRLTSRVLGPDVLAGHQVQTVVPEECWQGTKLIPGGTWALVGTTMVPGYHHAGFELATTADLLHFSRDVADRATGYMPDGA